MRAFAGIGWICLIAIISIAFQSKAREITWNKTIHDFGTLKKGEIAETCFTCYNGNDTLQLENVVPSCGCMTPDWRKTPIMPYDSAIIKLVFNTKGNSGKHTKYISVYSNKGLYELVIKANIEK